MVGTCGRLSSRFAPDTDSARSAGVTSAIIAKIHTDAARALQSAEVRDKLAADGAEAISSTPAEFTRFIRGELEKWGRVIKAAGLRAD